MRRRSILALTVAALALLTTDGCRHAKPAEAMAPKRPYPGVKNAPYSLRGRHFRPMTVDEALHYTEVGQASFYEAGGGKTATGERPKRGELYAAHRTLPLPCVVRITSVSTGRSCTARVCDRGPFHMRRIIDVSTAVAHELGFVKAGIHEVKIEVISVGDGPYQRKAEEE